MMFIATVNDAFGFISAADIETAERYLLEYLTANQTGVEITEAVYAGQVTSFKVVGHTVTIKELPPIIDMFVDPSHRSNRTTRRSRPQPTLRPEEFFETL